MENRDEPSPAGQRHSSGKMEEYRSKCNCPPCPTHAQCAKDRGELAFCVSKKSSCIKEMKVCFCPGCPVHEELGFQYIYYCMRGNEGEQKNKVKPE